MDPVGSLIGAVLIGLGTMLLYGSVKNRRVFGANGIVSEAIATGSIVSKNKIPEAFSTGGSDVVSTAKIGARGTRLPAALGAVSAIALVDPVLADKITAEITQANEQSSREDLTALAQLLAIADAKGFTTSTATIRAHILEVTGESI